MSYDVTKEAAYFFKCLFYAEISDDLVALYVRAHDKFGVFLSLDEKIAQCILSKRIDPIALEFVSRRQLPVLRNKLLLLCYLAESDGCYHHLFVNDDYRMPIAFLKMSYEIVKTPWLIVKGIYYGKRYGLF